MKIRVKVLEIKFDYLDGKKAFLAGKKEG